MKRLIRFLRDFFRVKKCAVCGAVIDESHRDLCRNCEKDYDKLLRETCFSCGAEAPFCRCDTDVSIGSDRQTSLFFLRSGFSRRLVYSLKRQGRRRTVDFLTGELAEVVDRAKGETNLSAFVITYIPRRKKSIRHYGFDQTELLATALSKRLSIPLVRAFRHTGRAVQKKKSKRDRKENAEKSYVLLPSVPVEGKNWILLDDVITTGSTMRAGARLLKQNGAGIVWAISVAKS